jgi:hypothetical protein
MGSGLCLIGAAMGIGCFFPTARVDIRIPYAFAACGQLSVVVSLGFVVMLQLARADLIATLTGALTIGVTASCFQIACIAAKEAWRFNHLMRNPECRWFERSVEHRTGRFPAIVLDDGE